MAKVQIAYESRSDISAIRADGYTDGLVNSDQAYDSATEELRGGLVTEAAIEAQVVEWSEEYRRETIADMKRPAKEQQSLAEFITHGEGNKVRSQKEQQELLESYLDAWRAGFRQRLRKGVGAMRNEAHECAEGCGCESSSGYLDAVQQSLADLGSDDPAGDVARNAKYVRGAKKAGLEPKQAAAMILAMSQRDPADYQPRYRYEDVAETASEYVAVDHRGKKVFGPTRDYGEAKMHADRSGGVVKFEMGAREGGASEGVLSWRRTPAGGSQSQGRFGGWTITPSDAQFRLYYGSDPNQPSSLVGTFASIAAAKSDAEWREERMSMQPRGEPVPLEGGWPVGETKASEGPHAQPFNVAPSVHACTVDSSTAIAAQIPGGPWKYLKTYPKEAPARIERRRDFDVKMPDGSMGRVTANFCGKHLLLRCPTSGTQYLFESVCVGDVPGPAGLPPRPEVQPVKGKPFTVKIRRGRVILKESGPFAKVTEAAQSFQDKSSFESGDTATVYDGAKVADYRGGRAVFGFGRTRWSRA